MNGGYYIVDRGIWAPGTPSRYESGAFTSNYALNSVNIELLLALAAHSMGLEEEAQRIKFYDRVRRELLVAVGAPAEYLYNMVIKIAYEVKYGES